MKITDITTRLIKLPAEDWFAPGPVPAGHVPFWEMALTTLHTDEGIEGYTMGYGPLGQGRGSAYHIHDVYYYDLVGKDPLNHEAIWQEMRKKGRHLYNMTDTVQGDLDVALWDIKGKFAGLPIAVLLGKVRDKVRLYRTYPPHTVRSVEQVGAAIDLTKKEGYTALKLQLLGDVKTNIERLTHAREKAGPDFTLMLDASAQLSFVDALEIGELLDHLRFEWFEEPIPDRHILQLKKLCERVKTPILAGETISLFEMPQYLIEGAVDVMRADTHIKRGITGLMKALAVCELMGYELEIHTASSPLLDVANLHVACATHLSNFVENHHSMFRFGLKGNPLDVQSDGCQHLPAGPGLGVEIDWDWMDNNTSEVIKGCRY